MIFSYTAGSDRVGQWRIQKSTNRDTYATKIPICYVWPIFFFLPGWGGAANGYGDVRRLGVFILGRTISHQKDGQSLLGKDSCLAAAGK